MLFSNLGLSDTISKIPSRFSFSAIGAKIGYDKNPDDFNISEEEPMSVEFDFSKYGTGDENDEDED